MRRAARRHRSGRRQEAEQVYRDDWKKHPGDGWARFGLARSLKLQGETAEAAAAEKEFRAAWTRADTELKSPCLCQPGRSFCFAELQGRPSWPCRKAQTARRQAPALHFEPPTKSRQRDGLENLSVCLNARASSLAYALRRWRGGA